MLLQFVRQPLIEATRYEREVLRCGRCLEQHIAPLPEVIDVSDSMRLQMRQSR
jgi:hypothetical protein